MTTAWKYTDATQAVVFRVNLDGSVESKLASALTFDELTLGILPFDPPLPLDPRSQDFEDAKNDAGLAQLNNLRISAVDQYIDDHVTTLATARTVLKMMAKAIIVMWRNTL